MLPCILGDEVVIIKNGSRLCGAGGCIATASIVQDKAYFEVKVQRAGQWGIGLALGNVDVNQIPFGADSKTWVLREDGKVYHEGQTLGQLPQIPRESDVVVSSSGKVRWGEFCCKISRAL